MKKIILLTILFQFISFAGTGGVGGGSTTGPDRSSSKRPSFWARIFKKPKKPVLSVDVNSSWEEILAAKTKEEFKIKGDTVFIGSGRRAIYDLCIDGDHVRTKEEYIPVKRHDNSRDNRDLLVSENGGYLYYPINTTIRESQCENRGGKDRCKYIEVPAKTPTKRHVEIHKSLYKTSPERLIFKKWYHMQECID